MSQSSRITRSPTTLTILLSLATLAGYTTYRLTTGTEESQSDASTADHDDHDHSAAALADSLPEVVLDDLAGTPTALSNWVGQPLLVNFWATWCGPCRREIPMLKIFHDLHTDIEVIGIAVDRLDDVLAYADEIQFNYPNLVGQSDGVNAMAAFHNDTGAMPFSAFVAADGAVLATYPGPLHQEHLDAFAETVELMAAGSLDRAQARTRLAEALEPD